MGKHMGKAHPRHRCGEVRSSAQAYVSQTASTHVEQATSTSPSKWSLDILPWFLALAFGRAWLTLTYSAPSVALPSPTLAHYDLFDYAYCVTSLLIALLARRIVPICEARWAKPASLGCMLVASCLCIATMTIYRLPSMQQATGMTPAMLACGSVVAGVGFALFLLLWSEALSTLSVRRIVIQLAASQILAAAILFFCQDLGTLRMGIAILVLPLLAILSIARAYQSASSASRPRRLYARCTFPWKIVLLLGVYSFAYGMRQQALVAADNVYTTVAMVTLMAVLFCGARFFSERFSLSWLYRSPIPLMACGFLLVPAEGIIGEAASNLLVSMSWVLASTLLSLLLYDIAKRLGLMVIMLFGMKNAMQVFTVWGSDFTSMLTGSGVSLQAQSITMGIIAIGAALVATFILFSERELTTKWGVALLDSGSLGERSRQEELASLRCDELTSAYRLSPREDEILRLLAKHQTQSSIARELGIAEGTVKAHASHIYEKLGVSGRKDLNELLGISEGE